MANLGAIVQDVMLGEQIAMQLAADDAALKAGQPASATIPLAIYGHQGNFTLIWNPNGSGIAPTQVMQNAQVAQVQDVGQIGRSSGVPISIGGVSNGLSPSGAPAQSTGAGAPPVTGAGPAPGPPPGTPGAGGQRP